MRHREQTSLCLISTSLPPQTGHAGRRSLARVEGRAASAGGDFGLRCMADFPVGADITRSILSPIVCGVKGRCHQGAYAAPLAYSPTSANHERFW